MKHPFTRVWSVVILLVLLTACSGNQSADPTATPVAEVAATATTAEAEPTATEPPAEPTATKAPTATAEPTAPPEPEGESVAYGDIVRGSIEAGGDEVMYTFEGTEEDTVLITVETVRGQMEPTISLYDSDDTLLATSEAAGEFIAQLNHTLEADGDYYLLVAGLGGDTGTYELTISNPQVGGTLEYGDVVSGILDDTNTEGVWEFEGSAGDFVAIAVRAEGELDTRIDLYYGEDSYIASDDDSEEDLNPYIAGYPLLRDGTYTIIISVVGSESEGSYEMELLQAEEAGGELILDEPVEGELDEVSQLWTFEGEAGQEISIVLDSTDGSNLDPYVALFDPDGERIASDDDSGEDANALIREFTLPASGTYGVVISAFRGAGGFILTVGGAIEPVSAGVIAYDETLEGEIVGTELQAWTFEAQPGDVVTIAVNRLDESSGPDVKVALLDPAGNEMTSDDDSGGNNNALIDGYPLVAGGTYTIVVSTFSGSGAYEVTISNTAAAALAIGDTVSGEIVEDGFVAYVVEGQEGDVLTFSATRANEADEELDLYLTLLGPDGAALDSDDDSGGDLNPQIEAIPLPITGTYLIVVEAISGEGAFELTVNVAE